MQFQKGLKQAITGNLLFTSGLGLLYSGAYLMWFKDYYLKVVPFIFLYFFLIGFLAQYMLLKTKDRNPGKFVSGFSAVTVVKLFSSLVIMAMYCFAFRDETVAFIGAFASLYFCFTCYEVVSLMKMLK